MIVRRTREGFVDLLSDVGSRAAVCIFFFFLPLPLPKNRQPLVLNLLVNWRMSS